MNRADFTPGKLPQEYLALLLKAHAQPDERVVVGARIGEDAAVIDMGTHYLIAKSDPITFATDQIGYYAVQVNANDIATRGGTPRWFLATLLLPEQTTATLVEEIFAQLSSACRALGITLIGGHTEITYGLDRPILSGHMLGEVAKEALITTAGARVGDSVFLSKGICVEGTSIIAREKFSELLQQGFSEAFLRQAQQFLFTPGIGVVRDAKIARELAPIHSMHDP
ncbi:MAG: hydrogenase expression/formation protein, partial [Nitrospinota bacterium]